MAWATSCARPSLDVILAVLAVDCGGEVAMQPTAAPAITIAKPVRHSGGQTSRPRSDGVPVDAA